MLNVFPLTVTFAALAVIETFGLPMSGLQVPSELDITYADGTNLTTILDQEKLGRKPVSEICNSGVWIIYMGYGYTFNENGGSGALQILYEDGCPYSFIKPVGSARLAGLRPDNSVPSVTLFDETDFQGNAFIFEDELRNLTRNVMSVVTINAEVELFKFPNFEGESVCLHEGNYDRCLKGVCYKGQWYNEFPWDVSYAQSARLGCSNSAKRYKSKKIGNRSEFAIFTKP